MSNHDHKHSVIPPNVPFITARVIADQKPDWEHVAPVDRGERSKTRKLFITSFVSALLILAGLSIIGAMIFPALVELAPFKDEYRPVLPIAEAREENFISFGDVPAKELYPPLGAVEGAVSGDAIRIPSLNIDVPLVMSPSLEDDDVLETLNIGAALYPNGILPGHLGNTFISAHSTGEPWRGKYRFAFLRINELQPGHLLHVDYNGSRYTYRMTRKDIVTPTPEFRVISNRPVPTVTLMACWPLWTTSKRMLITGELTNVTKLTPEPPLVATI